MKSNYIWINVGDLTKHKPSITRVMFSILTVKISLVGERIGEKVVYDIWLVYEGKNSVLEGIAYILKNKGIRAQLRNSLPKRRNKSFIKNNQPPLSSFFRRVVSVCGRMSAKPF